MPGVMKMGRLEELAETFSTLGNENRLLILQELQRVRGFGDIELTPSREDDDRRISREAIRKHVGRLEELDLVREVDRPGRARKFR